MYIYVYTKSKANIDGLSKFHTSLQWLWSVWINKIIFDDDRWRRHTVDDNKKKQKEKKWANGQTHLRNSKICYRRIRILATVVVQKSAIRLFVFCRMRFSFGRDTQVTKESNKFYPSSFSSCTWFYGFIFFFILFTQRLFSLLIKLSLSSRCRSILTCWLLQRSWIFHCTDSLTDFHLLG